MRRSQANMHWGIRHYWGPCMVTEGVSVGYYIDEPGHAIQLTTPIKIMAPLLPGGFWYMPPASSQQRGHTAWQRALHASTGQRREEGKRGWTSPPPPPRPQQGRTYRA